MSRSSNPFGEACLARPTTGVACARDNPRVGEVVMFAELTTLGNAANTTAPPLATAVHAAGAAEPVRKARPFAGSPPPSGAFGTLPTGTVARLIKPEQIDPLVRIPSWHLGGAKVMAADPLAIVLGDGDVRARDIGNRVTLTRETGGVAKVTAAEALQSTRVIRKADRGPLPTS